MIFFFRSCLTATSDATLFLIPKLRTVTWLSSIYTVSRRIFRKHFWCLSLMKTWILVCFCSAKIKSSYDDKTDAKTSGSGIVPLLTVCGYWHCKCVWKNLGLSYEAHFLLHPPRIVISSAHSPYVTWSVWVPFWNYTFKFLMLGKNTPGIHSVSSALFDQWMCSF